jgi:hypothetical protein
MPIDKIIVIAQQGRDYRFYEDWSQSSLAQLQTDFSTSREVPHAFFRNINPSDISFQSTEIVSPVVT